jgi:predicted site-specific integrase-resolvase
VPAIIGERAYYRTLEACQIAGVSRSTFFRWLKTGVIDDVTHKDRRGWRLFTEKDISKIKAEANKIR